MSSPFLNTAQALALLTQMGLLAPVQAAPVPQPVRAVQSQSLLTSAPRDVFVKQAAQRSTVSQASQKTAVTGAGVTDHPARLNLPQWQTFTAGPNNAITDVPGIKVGQITVKRDTPATVRTGVTAIVPDTAALTGGPGTLADTGFRASSVSLNGNGELTGASFLNEFGVLNAPILLTNTRSVGSIHEGVNAWYDQHYPNQWSCALPVVGECYDGFFSTSVSLPPELAGQAIDQARGGPVPQGRVGAGTGMRSFGLHAGVGSASRQLQIDGKTYTIGTLVNMNHSRFPDLNPVIRQQLEARFGPLDQLKARDEQDVAPQAPKATPRQGSIQVVIATDLPLSNRQLEELAKRAGLGIGNTGSTMGTSSGDFATAFSTADPVPMGDEVPSVLNKTELHPELMTDVFRAAVEAVTEAQVNALVASHSE